MKGNWTRLKWEDYPENPIVVWPCLIWVSFMEISLWECAYTRKFSEILHASKEFTTKTGMKDLFFFFFFSVSSHAHVERTSLCLWRQAKGIFSWQNSSGTSETLDQNAICSFWSFPFVTLHLHLFLYLSLTMQNVII